MTTLTPALVRAMQAVRDGRVSQRYTTTGNVFVGPQGIGAASYRRLEQMKLIEDAPQLPIPHSHIYRQRLSAAGVAALDEASQ